MYDLPRLVQMLEERIEDIYHAMELEEWERFRAELNAIEPEVVAAQDIRKCIRIFYHLHNVFLHYPAVRGLLPASSGLLPKPPPPPLPPEPDPILLITDLLPVQRLIRMINEVDREARLQRRWGSPEDHA
jgi:hypothetical protein